MVAVPVNDDRLRAAARSLGYNPDAVEIANLHLVNDEARRLDGLAPSDGFVVGRDAPVVVTRPQEIAPTTGRTDAARAAPAPQIVTHIGPAPKTPETAATFLPPAVKTRDDASGIGGAVLAGAVTGVAGFVFDEYGSKSEAAVEKARDVGGLPLAQYEKAKAYGKVLASLLPGGVTPSEVRDEYREASQRYDDLKSQQRRDKKGDAGTLGGIGSYGASVLLESAGVLSGIASVTAEETVVGLKNTYALPDQPALPPLVTTARGRVDDREIGPPAPPIVTVTNKIRDALTPEPPLPAAPDITHVDAGRVTPPRDLVTDEKREPRQDGSNKVVHAAPIPVPVLQPSLEPSAPLAPPALPPSLTTNSKGSRPPLSLADVERRALLDSQEPPTMSLKSRLQNAISDLASQDLKQAGVATGAVSTPAVGAALPTFTTPADFTTVPTMPGASPSMTTVVGAIRDQWEALPSPVKTAVKVAGGVAAAGAVAEATRRVVKKAKAKKAASTPKKSKSSETRRSKSGAKRTKATSGKGRVSKGKVKREDAGGVVPATYKGRRVLKVETKNGTRYAVRRTRREGNMPAGTLKFIKS